MDCSNGILGCDLTLSVCLWLYGGLLFLLDAGLGWVFVWLVLYSFLIIYFVATGLLFGCGRVGGCLFSCACALVVDCFFVWDSWICGLGRGGRVDFPVCAVVPRMGGIYFRFSLCECLLCLIVLR